MYWSFYHYIVSFFNFLLLLLFFPFFLVALLLACRILVPWPGIEPMPLVMDVWGLNHWITRKSYLSIWPLFQVRFIWYEYCDPHFLVISSCMKYLFQSPHFQSVCVLCPKMGLFGAAYCVGFYLLFTASATLCLLIGAFSPLTFKAVVNRYVFISILNFFSHWFCISSFLLLFFLLWLDDFVLCYTYVFFFLVFVTLCRFLFVVTLCYEYVNPLYPLTLDG